MLRALAFVGPCVEAVAVARQLQWHALHGDVEPVASFLLAHSGIYAGALLGLAGAAAWLRAPRWRAAAALVALGAAVRIAALLADGVAHRSGWDVAPTHGLFRAGIAVAALGLLVGAAGAFRPASAAAR